MSDLRELYQEMILDHSKKPRNYEPLPDAECSCEGHNPLCGDRISVFVNTDQEKITEIRFQGTGCAICMASASMMTDALTGKSVWEAEQLFKSFQELVTGKGDKETPPEDLDKLIVFSGVRDFPVRIKCAILAWHTMLGALGRQGESVSTE